MQHFSLHSVCSSTGDMDFSKEEKGPKKNQGNCFIIREEIHSLYRGKCHFERRFFSYLDENEGDNPQRGDLEDSDLHHGGVHKQ